MSAVEEKGRRGRSLLTWTFGCTAVVFVLAAILALLNWSSLMQVVRNATHMVGELQTVQSAVAKKYGAPHVFVNRKYASRIPGPYLSIEVVDSPVLHGIAGDAAKAKALEIATLARDTLEDHDDYQHFEVIVSTTLGAGAWLTNSENFMFKSSDLPPTPGGTSP